MAKKESSGFVQMFIPNGKDNTGTLIRKILVIVCLITAIVCAIMIISEKAQDHHTEVLNNELQNIHNSVNSVSGSISATKEEINQNSQEQQAVVVEKLTEADIKEIKDANPNIDPAAIDRVVEEHPNIPKDLVALTARNEDCIGWVKCGHKIDYPVMMNEKTTDYYLFRDFDGNDSKDGSIFADNHVLPFEKANNLVLYGHNMASSEMFATLTYWYPQSSHGGTNYQDFYNYYKQYPTIEFQTVNGGQSTYKIFAGIFINTMKKDGYPYPYYRKRKFANEGEFMDFVGNIMDRSTFYTDVDLEYGDEFITLSTCYYYPLGKGVDARFALFARKVRDGENPEVDTEKVIVNSSPLFFETYENNLTGPWKGRDWVVENVFDWPSKVKNFENYDIDSLDEYESEGPIDAD